MTFNNYDARTMTTVPSLNFDRTVGYDTIVGFHDLFTQIVNADSMQDTKIPAVFGQIPTIRGIASEGTRSYPTQIKISGELAQGAVVVKNEVMETFDIQSYVEQSFRPTQVEAFIDYSATQGYTEEPDIINIETFAVAGAFTRFIRQITLNMMIKTLTEKKQTVSTYEGRLIVPAAAPVAFNPAIDDPTKALDFSAITKTSTDEEITAIVEAACAALWDLEQFRGKQAVILLPSSLWRRVVIALRKGYGRDLIRSDLSEMFLENTNERMAVRYNTFNFLDVVFIGIPSETVPDFGVSFENIINVDGFPADFNKAFPTDLSIAFFTDGICMSEQAMDILVGINRSDSYGKIAGVGIRSNDFSAEGVNLDKNIKMMMLEGVAKGRLYSDFGNKKMYSTSGYNQRSYTQFEYLQRSANKRIADSSRFKAKTFIVFDVIRKNGVINVKLPATPPVTPFRSNTVVSRPNSSTKAV